MTSLACYLRIEVEVFSIAANSASRSGDFKIVCNNSYGLLAFGSGNCTFTGNEVCLGCLVQGSPLIRDIRMHDAMRAWQISFSSQDSFSPAVISFWKSASSQSLLSSQQQHLDINSGFGRSLPDLSNAFLKTRFRDHSDDKLM